MEDIWRGVVLLELRKMIREQMFPNNREARYPVEAVSAAYQIETDEVERILLELAAEGLIMPGKSATRADETRSGYWLITAEGLRWLGEYEARMVPSQYEGLRLAED